MDANSTFIRHWEDVVFENRNKDYGAYLLRKAYAQRLMTGLGVTVVVVSILLSMQHFSSKKQKGEKPLPPITDKGHEFSPPPIIDRPEPPANPIRPPQVQARNTQILVTTEQVEERVVEAVREFVTEEGSDTGGTGTIDDTGTISPEDPAPVALPEVVDIAEIMPAYEGGIEAMMKFIQKKIRYPGAPRRLGIEGTVYVRFIVKGNGTVTDVKVIRGVHPDYDKEAVRVISMLPAWKGGSHNGRPVSVRMVLPIKFNLQD